MNHKLAIFDLDNTLLDGDSDVLWGEFLIEHGLVDGHAYHQENQRFYREYEAGTLDIHAFLRFALKPLREHDPERLERLRHQFMAERIRPIIPPAARKLVQRHAAADHTLLMITATNSFVTAPIAREFGIRHLLATEPRRLGNHFTGEVDGVPCFREGKVTRYRQWLQAHRYQPTESWFYSDSHNDLPLLEHVTRPHAVNPDLTLRTHARNKGWPILNLRGEHIVVEPASHASDDRR